MEKYVREVNHRYCMNMLVLLIKIFMKSETDFMIDPNSELIRVGKQDSS